MFRAAIDRSAPVLLEAVDLQFSYRSGGATPVIDGVSLAVPAGAVVGVLGPNGSGKTTLLKLLSGSLTPTAGLVTLDGEPLAKIRRPAAARRIAVVPQDTHLAFDYTALEIVLMGRYPRLGAFEIEGPDDVECAMAALSATGTREMAARSFPTLSGGEKQRVIIASALAQLDERPAAADDAGPAASLLVLDEPTASLDLRYQLELAALIGALRRDRGITMVLSTHDLRLAASVCTRLVFLSKGRVIADGTPGEVLTARLVGALYGVDAALVARALP